MKRRYWLSAAILLLLGLLVARLLVGFQFTGVLLCLSALPVLAFGLVDALRCRWPRAMKLLRRGLVVALCLLLLAMLLTGWLIGSAARGAEDSVADYVIVLGAGVNGTKPSQSLRERLLAAEAYLQAHPQAIAILSGGMGDRENISEAACMYRWLTARGMDPARLWLEDASTSTDENLRNSLTLIESRGGSRPATVAVVSSEYHLYRAGWLAREAGVTARCVPARTQLKPFFCNMFLREIFAVWLAWLGI